MENEKKDLLSCNLNELSEIVSALGEKPFRAKQIFKWLHQKYAVDFSQMSDLSEKLRQRLCENYCINSMRIIKKLVSKEDNTRKYLFETVNGNIIEGVLMKYEYGNAVCISSQAGCRMGCKFCASTIDGVERNLSGGEMLSQVYEISKDINERIGHIVIMGSGEPFDNFDNFLRFTELINSPDGANIGQRHITVSTCGLVDKIYELAEKKLQITLAVSLHAPNNEIRKTIMPVANRFDIDEVIKAAKYYADTTKRRVTFEYSLISGVNDSVENARELASRLKGGMFHVNLIPVNDVKERSFIRSDEKTINSFKDTLLRYNIEATVRRKLGSDINAACGQLRKGFKSKGVL